MQRPGGGVTAAGGPALAELSVVVPTLGSSRELERLLGSVATAAGEVVLVDGDPDAGAEAAALARTHGARYATSAPGRGTQIRAGCTAAAGAWLLVLHADSTLAPGWVDEVRDFIGDPGRRRTAACFRLAFDEDSRPARRTAALANLRTRLLALPYGDQGLLLSRALHDEVGGFRNLPIMEDVDIVRRIGRRRLHRFRTPIVTSAARYRRDGWLRRSCRNLACIALWFAGVDPERIRRLYETPTRTA